MLRCGETKVVKEKLYSVKKTVNTWDVNVDNIVTTKLVKTTTNSSKYLIQYLDKIIRPLVLILPNMSRYDKIFKVKDRDQVKKNKLMSFRVDDENQLEKYKTI